MAANPGCKGAPGYVGFPRETPASRDRVHSEHTCTRENHGSERVLQQPRLRKTHNCSEKNIKTSAEEKSQGQVAPGGTSPTNRLTSGHSDKNKPSGEETLTGRFCGVLRAEDTAPEPEEAGWLPSLPPVPAERPHSWQGQQRLLTAGEPKVITEGLVGTTSVERA